MAESIHVKQLNSLRKQILLLSVARQISAAIGALTVPFPKALILSFLRRFLGFRIFSGPSVEMRRLRSTSNCMQGNVRHFSLITSLPQRTYDVRYGTDPFFAAGRVSRHVPSAIVRQDGSGSPG